MECRVLHSIPRGLIVNISMITPRVSSLRWNITLICHLNTLLSLYYMKQAVIFHKQQSTILCHHLSYLMSRLQYHKPAHSDWKTKHVLEGSNNGAQPEWLHQLAVHP